MMAASLLGWIALGACQPGSAGLLDPVAAPGVERVDDKRWEHAATIAEGAVSARIVGSWSSERGQTVRITYRNAGRMPVRIRIAPLKIDHQAGEAALRTAVDATGVDMADAREDNDRGRVLYTVEKPATHGATVDIAPGETRELDNSLTSFSDTGTVAAGDRVVATIPMPTRTVSVTFTLAGASSPPF